MNAVPPAPTTVDPTTAEPVSYSISELAEEFDVTPRAIRFYESKGLLAPTRRGQQRVFSRRDRARLSLILRGKRVGFSLDELKELLDLYELKDGKETQLRHALVKFEERVALLEAQREDIDAAIRQLHDSHALVSDLLARKTARGPDPHLVGYGVSRRSGETGAPLPAGEDFLGPRPVFDEG